MRQVLNIKTLPVSKIDFNDLSYSIGPVGETVVDDPLQQSISRYGTFCFPIVIKNGAGLYAIVAGRKRLLAIHYLQPDIEWPCLAIADDAPEIEVFRILLAEITLSRPLTPVEKAIFLQKISAVAEEDEIVREFLPEMGLPPNRHTIAQTVRLLDLEDPILIAVHRGAISNAAGRELCTLEPADRKILFGIITSLQLSFSNQKKILSICRELAGRLKTTIADLLDNNEVQGILRHLDANPPQKTKMLMRHLSGKYLPRATEAAADFHNYTSSLQLPQNVSVEHTPFFEDDALNLSITFPSRESLREAWEKIRHVIQQKDA